MGEKKQYSQLIFGFWPLIEVLKSGQELEKVLLQKGIRNEHFSDLMNLLKDREIPYQFVPKEKLDRASFRKNHQGAMGFISPIIYHNLDTLIPTIYERGEAPFLLLLDRVTDVRNFGAICRTAYCAGIHAVIIPAKGSALINEDAVKTSVGALLHLPVCREHNLKDSLIYLRNSGIHIVAFTEKSDKMMYNGNLQGPICIVMGSEEDGVSEAYLALCDEKLQIPMPGELDSLNVSVSAGIAIYEALRQRSISVVES